MIAFRVVIVDDDPDDRELLCESFEQFGIEPVLAFPAAQNLLDYLQGVDNDNNLPLLVVTDLNMPTVTGLELLSRLKLTPRFAHIPVVVWSTSNDTVEMSRAAKLGAASYFVKPLVLHDYKTLTRRMLQHVTML